MDCHYVYIIYGIFVLSNHAHWRAFKAKLGCQLKGIGHLQNGKVLINFIAKLLLQATDWQ
jgi:hypothetical protein